MKNEELSILVHGFKHSVQWVVVVVVSVMSGKIKIFLTLWEGILILNET